MQNTKEKIKITRADIVKTIEAERAFEALEMVDGLKPVDPAQFVMDNLDSMLSKLALGNESRKAKKDLI